MLWEYDDASIAWLIECASPLKTLYNMKRTIPMFAALLAFAVSVLLADSKQAKKQIGGNYEPVVRQIEGWTVHVEPALIDGEHAEEGAKALKMLGNHLQRVSILVPEKQLAELKKVEFWIEHAHPEQFQS